MNTKKYNDNIDRRPWNEILMEKALKETLKPEFMENNTQQHPIPTAIDLIRSKSSLRFSLEGTQWDVNISALLIEFAQLHCKTQLEAILNGVKITTHWGNNDFDSENHVGFTYQKIDKDSIKNAYPLTNIK